MIPFKNEPFTRFDQAAIRSTFSSILADVRAGMGREERSWIGGEVVRSIQGNGYLVSTNPARPTEAIGKIILSDASMANQAIEAADRIFQWWASWRTEDRAAILFKAAAMLRREKHAFSALLVLEVGKTWPEADGETAEAIDFLEYYAREALRLESAVQLTKIDGEHNQWRYLPLGVGVVIAPWNFPLAILAGMTSAALVCGNPVVVKPSSLTPIVAARWVDLMHRAGLPPEVLQFIVGPGGEIGDVLVDHPLTRFVCFTGSRQVGVRIYEKASKLQNGQRWLKRAIMELGGKDAIVVDENCDFEAAARAIVSSAFGFSGQKCSACSRAIVHDQIYGQMLERVLELTAQLKIGDPSDGDTQMGPVIDAVAQKQIFGYIEKGKQEATLRCGGKEMSENGWYVEPTIFADAPANGLLGQVELFGPVLAFHRASDFKSAIAMANATDYGLTGAVFSDNRIHLAYAREHYHVGNLYLNRKCTGALVGVHPFGGFQMSGTDSKAGGPDYLLLFTQGKVISEAL